MVIVVVDDIIVDVDVVVGVVVVDDVVVVLTGSPFRCSSALSARTRLPCTK